ncbi:hypothetical protein [Kitasatospora sp. SUK 42]|uniref:hypothetical protein n=1 Tax=Kitasatospora sp. SUK 42 TaxID=1588882 RepID=UPI0018CAEB6A|nr:hypothetical protein [Kitasatospora sp. SUK 42]MBV2151275.1 hypothetical protein [Kitasatospora sp. SUK 42]
MRADGQWQQRGRHRDPAAAAASYVIDAVASLALDCPLLAPARLEARANTLLGQPAVMPEGSSRLLWAAVHVNVTPEDFHDAQAELRHRARSRAHLQSQRKQVDHAVAYLNLLRADPTLAMVQQMLDSPNASTAEIVARFDAVAEKVAAYAPGGRWVRTVGLLEKTFGALDEDAQRYVVDRVCSALSEFRQTQEAAQHIRQEYQIGKLELGP